MASIRRGNLGPVAAERDGELTLSVERAPTHSVLSVEGELEFGTAAPLRSALLDLAHEHAGTLVLDLSGVDFIDSTGLSLLVQAKQRLDAQGSRFVLRNPAHRVMRVLEVAGLATVFDIE